MLKNNKIRVNLVLLVMFWLFSKIKCETESTNSDTKDETKIHEYSRWAHALANSGLYQNHKPYYNYVYNKNRESKSNNEPYFTEPSNNEGYETLPSTIQITALPAGFGALNPLLQGQFNQPAIHQTDPNSLFLQKYPVFVINKSKADNFKWLIPLLLLLGAPLLCGLILIPIVLQTVFFFFTIVRNLGFLLPLIPALTGNGNGNGPIIPTTG